jgi:AcrR family transcriptional regulator
MTETVSSEDQELVAALLSNATMRGAAEAAGVSESTVYRRLRDAGFLRELKERLRVYSHALQRLHVAAEGPSKSWRVSCGMGTPLVPLASSAPCTCWSWRIGGRSPKR